MKVTVKVKNKKTANERKCNFQPKHIVEDSDEDGVISSAIIKMCLEQNILPPLHSMETSVDYAQRKALAARDAARFQHFLDKGMIHPIVGNHDPAFGLVIIR